MGNNKIFKQQENLQKVNVTEAWQELSSIDPSIEYGDSSLVVAVVDFAGIESTTELIDGEEKVVPVNTVLCNTNGVEKIPLFYRMASGESNNNFSPLYSGNHGTCVAGLIGAKMNDYSVVGVAPNVRLISLELLDPQNDCNKFKAIADLLRKGCGVAVSQNNTENSSNFPNIREQDFSAVLNFSINLPDKNNIISDAINDITIYGRNGLGCIAVVAAGNEGKFFESQSFQDNYMLQLHKKTIVVGSIKYTKNVEELLCEKDESSNYGAIIDFVAPANQELTTSCVELGNACSLNNYVTILTINGNKVTVSDISVIKEGICVCYIENETIHNTYVEKVESSWILLHDTENLCVGSFLYYYSKENKDVAPIPASKDNDINSIYIEKKYGNIWLYKLKGQAIRVNTNNSWYCLHVQDSQAKYKLNKEDIYIVNEIYNEKIEREVVGYSIKIEEDMRSIIPQDENIESISPIYGDLFTNFNYTSAAAPIVSGIATLILSVNCNLNWLEVRDILKMSTSSIDTRRLGYGNIWCPLGKGLINAYIAIQRVKMYRTRYDLWIKRSEGDVGTDLEDTVDLNVPDSDLKCSPHTINTKISNIGLADSIMGAEIRYLIRFSDLSNPVFEFPDSWMENQVDSFLIGKDNDALQKHANESSNDGTVGLISSGESTIIKTEDITNGIGTNKISIEKILRKCPVDKHPYLLVHITPFDCGVTENSVLTNNNLAYKRDVFLNAEFMQGDGTTRLPNSLPKSETPVPFKINVKMYHKTGVIDLNGIEITVKGFVKKNENNPTIVFSKKYDGEGSWTGTERNNIVTDISTEIVDRNDQNQVTEVVISGKILISELYKILQITVTVPNCLNECTHEIRRKSAMFSKFTSALAEDMEFREKMYFYTDCDNLTNTQKYGPIEHDSNDSPSEFDSYRITNVFAVGGTNETNVETSTPHRAYAVSNGKILVQEDKDDASLVNVILKPETHSSVNLAVKYFVYRGILKSSLYENDNIVKDKGNSVVSWIEKNIKEADKRILGVEMTDEARYGDEAPIDNAFYSSNGDFELLTVPGGWCIGTFANDYIGFEIWLDTIGFNPTFSMIRNHEIVIEIPQLPENHTNESILGQKPQRENVLCFMDPAAYFGNMYNDRLFMRETNSKASEDGILYEFDKVKKDELYTRVLHNFVNKNVVYIDIRNEFNLSYNYFGNYGEILLDVINNDTQPTAEICYDSSGWPLMTFSFSKSFDDGALKIAFKKGDNEKPLAYVAIGERGYTLAEKVAKGKSNFVDLTIDETYNYTTNSVTVIVPFCKNTESNQENTYSSVASYVRVDYLRRMKQENNQEQQEPQVSETTNNLPIWKQRESSSDLLFRPMDMKLPIENVTEGFVVKVYEDDVYIDLPEQKIDYMARMGIARDKDNTYLFAVKSDLHTRNVFQMSNPRFSICSGVNTITKDQFMKYVFGGNYMKKEVRFEDGTAYVISYYSPVFDNFLSKSNEIDMNKEAELLVISNENYNKLLENIRISGFAENSIIYLSLKKNECEDYNEYTLSLQEVRPLGGAEESNESLLTIEIMKVLEAKA